MRLRIRQRGGLLHDEVAGEDDLRLAAEEPGEDGNVVFPGILGVDHVICPVFYDFCQLFGGGQVQDVFHGELIHGNAQRLHFLHQGAVHIVAQAAVAFAAVIVFGQQLHIPLGAAGACVIDQIQDLHLLPPRFRMGSRKARMGWAFIR